MNVFIKGSTTVSVAVFSGSSIPDKEFLFTLITSPLERFGLYLLGVALDKSIPKVSFDNVPLSLNEKRFTFALSTS